MCAAAHFGIAYTGAPARLYYAFRTSGIWPSNIACVRLSATYCARPNFVSEFGCVSSSFFDIRSSIFTGVRFVLFWRMLISRAPGNIFR